MDAITNSTAAFFRRSQSQMDGLRAQAEGLQQQISTGVRFQRSSEDPVASSRLRALTRADRLAGIESDNAARANQELGAASNRIDDITNTMIRVRELALQAANGSTSDAARLSIADEIAQLRQAIINSANATSVGGRSLFGGDLNEVAYAVDAAGLVIYQGSATAGSLELGDGIKVERGLTGPAVFTFDNAGTPTDIFAFIQSLENGIRGNAGDPIQIARDAIGGIDSALSALGKSQTIIGVRLGWIETVQQIQDQQSLDRTEEGSDIAGVDLASAITQMQQVLTVLEASQASFVKLASLSLFDRI